VSARLRICFVAPHAWPVLARDRSVQMAGGAEVQQSALARALAVRGHEVSMVCLDFGQPETVVVDGVTVHRAHAPHAGVPGLRFVHPRLSSIWRAMRRSDAQVYCQRNGGALTAIVAAFARSHGRLSLYAGASDADFDPALPMIALARDRALFRWGLRRVDAIVTQHPAQQQACSRLLGRPSTVIRSVYAHRGAPGRHEGDVLWVGTLKPIKAPELFVDLARSCPGRRFRMVGGGDAAQVAALRRRAEDLDNLVFTGFVPHADVEAQFDGASVLVNTSPAEGFPNTFLQAWSRGIPTLSFVDPRLGWQGRRAGLALRTLPDMADALDRWTADRAAWAEAGEACRRTYEATFSVDGAVDQYEALFAALLAQRQRVVPAVREAVE
jgi:glycosyltransferase involved in cell wall biosynthesis